MSDILFSVQQAVLSALAANAGVQAVLGATPPLYDHVPQNAAFPYVVFGPVHVVPNDTKRDIGFEQILTLNIWSRYRGGKETRDIFQAVYDTLHRAALNISGQTFVSCEFHSADFSLDSDGLTYFAAARFSIITQNN
jgi:hypothetical protein